MIHSLLKFHGMFQAQLFESHLFTTAFLQHLRGKSFGRWFKMLLSRISKGKTRWKFQRTLCNRDPIALIPRLFRLPFQTNQIWLAKGLFTLTIFRSIILTKFYFLSKRLYLWLVPIFFHSFVDIWEKCLVWRSLFH